MSQDLSQIKDGLNKYLSDGIHQVNGWCLPELWHVIWPLRELVGPGPIAEIGVFEGKFFIGLAKTFCVEGDFTMAAIDVFDMQQFNLDGAGVGKLNTFQNNLDRHGVNVNSVEFLRRDSLTLDYGDAKGLIDRHGKFKFFSVDGCHEVIHTINDIEFAMSVTDNAGLISVDDYNNPSWPGAGEGVAKMYLMREFSFVPLLFTSNKLLLCSYSYHKQYLDAVHEYVAENYDPRILKRVKRFGYDTLTIMPRFEGWHPLK